MSNESEGGEGADARSPWVRPMPGDDDRGIEEARHRLLVALERTDLAQVEKRTAYILQHFPETRDDDRALLVHYWRVHQPNILEDWDPLRLEVIFDLDHFSTITRMRRHIQNQLGLFRGVRVRAGLFGAQLDFFDYVRRLKKAQGEIRFYLDETGMDPHVRYAGVAGICVLDWRQYEKHYAGLTHWREQRGWPETLRFSRVTNEETLGHHFELLNQLRSRQAGLLFVGHQVMLTANKQLVMSDLMTQLVLDSLQRARDLGSLQDERDVVIIKEAEELFDSRYLPSFREALSREAAERFGGAISIREVTPVKKGREVFLECADQIAGAMQRSSLRQGEAFKDRLAEAVLNVTGLDEDLGPGVKYRIHTD